MARRSDHSRDQLSAMVVNAARDIVIAEGASAVTMRKIAADIGYAAGSIYNVVGDQDAVLRQVNAQTLDGLVARLTEAPAHFGEAPMERALRVADGYVDYVSENPRLWAALLERPPLPGEAVPDYYAGPRGRLIEIVAEAIAPFFPDQVSLRRAVIALWAALQGVAALTIGGNLAFLGDGVEPKGIARSIVRRYLTGTE
jgi:AcrR family transcriptional regulator